MSSNTAQQRAKIRKNLEKKSHGFKILERINPDTGNPFTDQEIDKLMKPDNKKFRILFGGGMGGECIPTGSP